MNIPILRKSKEKDRETKNPIQQRLSLLNDMEKHLFDSNFWRPFDLLGDEIQRTLQHWTPKTDIVETETALTITANIPGVKPEDVQVEVDNHALIIKGKTEEQKEEKGKTWYRMERESGELYRRFELPDNVDIETLNARIEHGTLTITIQKKPSAARKQIAIEHD